MDLQRKVLGTAPARSRMKVVAFGLAAAAAAFYLWRRRKARHSLLPLIRVPSSSSADEVAAVLRSHGVVVIEDVIPAEMMDRAVAELKASGGKFKGGLNSFAGHHTVRNAAKPLGESEVVQQLAVEQLVVGAVEALLKPWTKRVLLGTCSAISVEPPPAGEDPAPSQVLHRDDGMWGASMWKWLPDTPEAGRPDFSVSAMWALSDFTVENGATRFLPGSHKWSRGDEGYTDEPSLPNGLVDGRDTIQAAMKKGSVVLWSGGTLHGATSHGGDAGAGVRHGLLFIYNLGWLRTEHNFHWAMPPEVIEGFGPKLADLLGRTGENGAAHPWFTGPVYTQPYLGGAEQLASGDGVQF